MKLFIIRHGETVHNAARRIQGPLIDDWMNDRGVAQARALEDRFARERAEGLRLRGVVASPLKRAFQTAEAVARGAGVGAVATEPGFMEFSWGDYLGRVEDDDLRARMKDIHARWLGGDLDHAAPRGESPREAWRRAEASLARLLTAQVDIAAEAAPSRPIDVAHETALAVVAHGRINKVMLSMLVHDDLRRMDDFPQGNTSVTLLEPVDARAPVTAAPGSWRAVYVNAKDHLDGLPALEENVDMPGGQGTFI